MFTKASIIAALVAIAAAIDPTTQWATDNPTIKPALGENVAAGVPYEVTWTATTPNKISIWLYKGPSTNVVPQFTLAVGIDNTGKATVTIPKTVANSPGAGYGLQLRDDVTGQYQYTPQFGITGAGEAGTSSSSSSASASGYPTGTPSTSKSASHSSSATKNHTSSAYPTTIKTTILTTGYPTGHNTTVATHTPTSSTASATRAPSSTTTGPAQSTGAAGVLKAGAALAAGVAGLVAAFI